MVEQVIEFLRGAFNNLKVCEALVQMALPAAQTVQVLAGNGAAMPATMVVMVPAPLASAPQPTAALPALPASLSWAVPPRKNRRPPAPGMKFSGDPRQMGFFLAQVWTYMQDLGPNLPRDQGSLHDHGAGGNSGRMDGHSAQ